MFSCRGGSLNIRATLSSLYPTKMSFRMNIEISNLHSKIVIISILHMKYETPWLSVYITLQIILKFILASYSPVVTTPTI
jgi:hypothetical protein